MKPFLLWLLLAQGADIATTIPLLRSGCREQNPVFGSHVAAGLALKGGATVGISITLPLVHRTHPTLAKSAASIAAISGTIGAALNARQLTHGCR